mmetsp:Transcript_24713/g.48627  ORF Transcript_24713/g.48627 Transcript_24713/m.48627 type:complete len:238 (+) Transcript_24713:18-731(+)
MDKYHRLFVILGACIFGCLAGIDCELNGEDYSYLRKDGEDYQGDFQGITYKFNVCGLTHNAQCSSVGGSACSFQGEGVQNVLAKSGGSMAEYAFEGAVGVAWTYTDGDNCASGSLSRQTKIAFVCDQKQSRTTEVVVLDNEELCVTTIEVAYPDMCPHLSGGDWFLIIVPVLVLVACGGSCIYRKYKLEKEGADVVPALEFWKSIPGLVKVGCQVSYQFVRTKVFRQPPGEDAYEQL